MVRVSTEQIKRAVKRLCLQANQELTPDILDGLKRAIDTELSPLGKDILDQLIVNAKLSKDNQMALCQDTGMVVVFVEVGQGIFLSGVYIEDAINQGIREAYQDYYFRHSIVADPFNRENTSDNTPAVIHTRIVPGDHVRIRLSPKGFGSENMSRLTMLKPAQGVDGVKQFVLDTVRGAGGNPCPPMVVGVGIGGTMEKAAQLSKEALLRPVNQDSSIAHIAELERDLLASINRLGIGPQGFGGTSTALGVNVETFPTHIAGLPVAVNISCHVTRHQEIIIYPEVNPDD